MSMTGPADDQKRTVCATLSEKTLDQTRKQTQVSTMCMRDTFGRSHVSNDGATSGGMLLLLLLLLLLMAADGGAFEPCVTLGEHAEAICGAGAERQRACISSDDISNVAAPSRSIACTASCNAEWDSPEQPTNFRNSS